MRRQRKENGEQREHGEFDKAHFNLPGNNRRDDQGAASSLCLNTMG